MRALATAFACLVPSLLFALASDPDERRDAGPAGEDLTGRQVYERVLDIRYRAGVQQIRVVSLDPGGSEQWSRFTLSLQDSRDARGAAVDGVLGSVLIQVWEPFDVRHTAYLAVARDPGPDDEFIYASASRRVRRADLKSTPLLGTDFRVADVAYESIDDAEYHRLPDEQLEGVPVYVVEAIAKPGVDVDHARTVTYLEQERLVPLRTRFWDEVGVEIRELTADRDSIREFGEGLWLPTKTTMRDLLQGTHSSMFLDAVDPEPDFPRDHFSLSRLERGH